MNLSQLRSKWAAVGAAVAVSLGAGGIGITHATTSSGEMPIYLPIEPCRLASLRPAPNTVGPRATPLGANETYTLSGWGTVGSCTLPSATAGLALNVTAVGASAPTFLTLFPAGVDLPEASNLNPAPGQPPTPNAVNIDLNDVGEFSIYNLAGSVQVIIDVVGIYDDHVHTGADIVDSSLTKADTLDEPGVAYDFMTTQINLTGGADTVASTAIRVPSDGYVSMEVTGLWANYGAGADVAFCQLQLGTTGAVNTSEPWFRVGDGDTTQTWQEFTAHRIMPISVADNPLLFTFGQSVSLVCDEFSGDVRMDEVFISATFYASSYRPIGLIIIPLSEAVTDGASSQE